MWGFMGEPFRPRILIQGLDNNQRVCQGLASFAPGMSQDHGVKFNGYEIYTSSGVSVCHSLAGSVLVP